MPTTVLNFDLFTHNTIEITKRGRTWSLRDDVPTETLMMAFALFTMGERIDSAIKEAEANGGDFSLMVEKLRARFLEIKGETAGIVAAVFCHSYPETTTEEIFDLFSFAEMMRIMDPFFTILSEQFKMRPSATTAPATQPETKKKPTPLPNRTQRRASVKHS